MARKCPSDTKTAKRHTKEKSDKLLIKSTKYEYSNQAKTRYLLLVTSSKLKFAKTCFSEINIFEHCVVNNVSINRLVQSVKKYRTCVGF